MQDIETIWNNTKENNPIEYTPYITFVKEQRPLIKKENPTMSFGEISKEVGKLWKIEKEKQPPKTKQTKDAYKKVLMENFSSSLHTANCYNLLKE